MNVKDITVLIDHLEKSSLVELELKIGDTELALRKKEAFAGEEASAPSRSGSAPVSAAREIPAAPAAAAVVAGETIDAPIVGTFYRAPSPDSPPFVEEGTVVKAGQTIGILEAMKVMNELEADFDCRIVSILVENGEMVEYGTPMFAVERV